MYNHMVVGTMQRDEIDRLFHSLADATRRDIVARTMTEEYSVSELARCYSMSFAAVQKHVAVLERARLVTKRRQGRERLVTANPGAIRTAARLLEELEELWRHRIGRMGEILAESDPRSGEAE